MSTCINPSLIRQYLYCPAAAYYIMTGAAEPPTERMRAGKEVQREAVEAVAKALGAEKIEHSPRLEGGGLCGVVDAVLWLRGRPAPLEVKLAKPPRKIPVHHKAQAAAYAVAAQHHYGKAVASAYIYYTETGEVKYIALTRDLVELVKHTAQQIRKIQNGWTPTPAYHPAKCSSCWYRKYCGFTSPHVEKI
ncbi:CRISPR-associated protein Cas4 [Pyrobaculum aerophilum]|uniref:CRISPR-associated exonuclease Cas4 n=1 Tax=Pyrobaculum aerophilum TaxID=13773 RepID=A0A371QUG1_9CREN|nr:CRISPR-associated protein Cas4 [Pyrobaculum aerophilum]RFA93076.1 CRISPR-associated protein Cas4 [Pyrobaculum aerophilum]RFA99170.1 CRISPR-associated protein Cas4 [Pyrobaculum aerophilum]